MDSFKYREIRGYFTARTPDTIDADYNPDQVPLNGNVTLVPQFQGGSVVFTEAGEFAIPRRLLAQIVDGHLMTEVSSGEESVLQPVFLPVTVDDRANQKWSWRLVFDSLSIRKYGEEVTHPDLSFPVEDGVEPMNLSTVATAARQSGAFITRGAPGPGLQTIVVDDGELTFEYTDGRTTSIGMPEAVPGPPGEPGQEGAPGKDGVVPDLVSSNIVDASATGRSVLTAANAAAARSAIGAGTTTVSPGTPSELNTGTATTARSWTPKALADYTKSLIPDTTGLAVKAQVAQDIAHAVNATKPDLVGPLQQPVIVAHRGGGKNVYPEQGLRGMIAAAEDGFLPEFDIQFLGDSTPVLCHDTTVNRTMTGVTGNVSSLTKEQWRKARLNPVYKGGRDDRPLLLEDALDYLGGRTVLVPEIKKDATMAQVDIVIDLILDRGLERAVLMQSFNYDACLRIAAAGMEVVYLHGTGPSVSWQAMLDAGIRYWGPNRTGATAAKMNEAAAAGIRVVPYTVEEPWHVKDLPTSVFGYFSNDPWGDSGRFGSYGTPRWEVGEAWPARRNTDEDENKIPTSWSGFSIRGGQLHVPQPARLSSISLEHLTGGFVQSPVRLEATFRFGASASSGSANAGFHLIRNDQDDSRLFADTAVPGQQGYTIGLRRNGTLDAWQYVNGAPSSKVGTNAGGSLGFIANETGSVTLVVELVGTKLTAKCITNGATFEADVSVTGSFRPYLRINSTEVLFESVSVTQL